MVQMFQIRRMSIKQAGLVRLTVASTNSKSQSRSAAIVSLALSCPRDKHCLHEQHSAGQTAAPRIGAAIQLLLIASVWLHDERNTVSVHSP